VLLCTQAAPVGLLEQLKVGAGAVVVVVVVVVDMRQTPELQMPLAPNSFLQVAPLGRAVVFPKSSHKPNLQMPSKQGEERHFVSIAVPMQLVSVSGVVVVVVVEGSVVVGN